MAEAGCDVRAKREAAAAVLRKRDLLELSCCFRSASLLLLLFLLVAERCVTDLVLATVGAKAWLEATKAESSNRFFVFIVNCIKIFCSVLMIWLLLVVRLLLPLSVCWLLML